MLIGNRNSGFLLTRGLFCLLAALLPSAAIADIHLYKGTLEVKKTSGAICGINAQKSYQVQVIFDSNKSGIEGYFHGRDLSTGHFKGKELGHLQVSYPYDEVDLAEGHSISLQPWPAGLLGELREKPLRSTEENCNFDSALLNLKREPTRDGEIAWKEASVLWQMELLNRRTFNFTKAGRYGEAMEAAQDSLALASRHFGPESSTSSAPLSNLAVIYRILGRHTDAEALCKRVLALEERTLGPDHQTVGISLINLAELYEESGRHLQAVPLYQRALVIYEKALGPEHPDVALAVNNLAVLYQNLGKDREADPLFLRAITIMTNVFGPNHPSVLTLRRNLEELRKKHTAADDSESHR